MKKGIKTPNTFLYTCLTHIVLAIFIVIATAGGCANKTNVEALEAKIISPGNDIEIKEGEAVFFKGLATGGSPPYKYLWHLGSVAPDISGQHTHEIIFQYEGAYTAIFTVTDTKGNKDTDAISIVVTPAESLN